MKLIYVNTIPLFCQFNYVVRERCARRNFGEKIYRVKVHNFFRIKWKFSSSFNAKRYLEKLFYVCGKRVWNIIYAPIIETIELATLFSLRFEIEIFGAIFVRLSPIAQAKLSVEDFNLELEFKILPPRFVRMINIK